MDELTVALKAREFISKAGPLALPVSIEAYVLALAIIGARTRKQRRFLLRLAANGAGNVLTLSASALALFAAYSPTDGSAHITSQ